MGNKKTENRNKINSLEQQITPGTGITVSDSTDRGVVYKTKFTVPSTTQAVSSAALAFGKLLGTLPAGNIFVHAVHVDITQVADGACAVTPEFGVGTVIATGAVSVLGGTATFENCLDGTAGTAFNGTTEANSEIAAVGQADIKDGTSTPKSLYLNIAGNWNVTVGLTYSGTVTVIWSVL